MATDLPSKEISLPLFLLRAWLKPKLSIYEWLYWWPFSILLKVANIALAMGCSRKGRHLSVQKNNGRVIGTQLDSTTHAMPKTTGIFTAFFRGCLVMPCAAQAKSAFQLRGFKKAVTLQTCEFTRKHRPPAADWSR